MRFGKTQYRKPKSQFYLLCSCKKNLFVLGFKVFKQGMNPNPAKVQEIKLNLPKNVTGVIQILNFFDIYQKFIFELLLAAPIVELVRGKMSKILKSNGIKDMKNNYWYCKQDVKGAYPDISWLLKKNLLLLRHLFKYSGGCVKFGMWKKSKTTLIPVL